MCSDAQVDELIKSRYAKPQLSEVILAHNASKTGVKEPQPFIKKYNPDILSAHVEEVSDPTCIPGNIAVKKNLRSPNNRINLVRRFQKKDYAQTAYRTPAILNR